jgi:hypothetical protein
MTLRLLFGIHAILTFAAGVVLVAAPGAILTPRVGMRSAYSAGRSALAEMTVGCLA